ncbi:MAG: hypothetical protein WBF13_12260 [Candidatus Zixiibacteriota bacterium]
MWKVVTLVLMLMLVPVCYDGVDVDLSGLSESERSDFGSSRAVSRYVYALATLGLPDKVNGRFPFGRQGLWQQIPGEYVNEWEWGGEKYTFESVIDMSCQPMVSKRLKGDLIIEYLQVCDVGEEYCVEFMVDGLHVYQMRTLYRVDLLVRKGDRWYFLWGGCPVMDWGGHRAFWGVGWIDKDDIKQLMGKKKEVLVLLEVRDLLTAGQKAAVKLLEIQKGRR